MRLILLLCSCLIVGCIQRYSGPRAEGGSPAQLRHTVRYSGETLGLIAVWYTGNAGNWPVIAKLNALGDPRRLQIGDRIVIPAALIRRRQPLPRALTEQSRFSVSADRSGTARAANRFAVSSGGYVSEREKAVSRESAPSPGYEVSDEALEAARRTFSELRAAAELSVIEPEVSASRALK